MEIKWLRGVVAERDGAKKLHEIYNESGLVLTDGVFAAGAEASAAMGGTVLGARPLSAQLSQLSAVQVSALLSQLQQQAAIPSHTIMTEPSRPSKRPKIEGQINWKLK